MTAVTTNDLQRSADGRPLGKRELQTEEPLGDDDVFHLLRARRRRLVLRFLRGREGPVEMREVAEQVAAWEHDTTLEALRSKERQRVYIALYQTHLPKLDEAGVIEYDQSRGIVDPTDRIDQLYDVLGVEGDETVTDGTGEKSRPVRDLIAYYGGASLVSTGIVTATWAGLIALPGVIVASMVTVLFALLTVGVATGK